MKTINKEQLDNLKIGDTIKRYSSQAETKDNFYQEQGRSVDTFIIKTINPLNQMIGLIIQKDVNSALSDAPVNIARLYKKRDDFIIEGVWWI
ncbi:MAG TPA: hypothetical protein VN721_05665 [Flavipsychrobacter sp.]|nr:hypothetical protein [Flavipsychrobacter sp.]